MKKTIVLFGAFIAIGLMLNSCSESLISDEGQDVDRQKSLVLTNETECGTPVVYDLKYYAYPNPEWINVGSLTVTNTGTSLILNFEVFPSDAGWGIYDIYYFIGNKEDIPLSPEGEIDWGTEGFTHLNYPEWQGNLSITEAVPLDVLLDCFYIAVKVRLRAPDPEGGYPLQKLIFPSIMINGERTDIWNNQYCIEECDSIGTGTPGYWKNHPEAWPVESITIGGVEYTKTDAIQIMWSDKSRDKTYGMFSHLVAAKLNLLIGTDPSCIAESISLADTWMASHPAGSGVLANSATWKEAEGWFTMLDNYNNGLLCAPPRD